MKFVYLDKKDRILAWFTPRNTAATAVGLAVLLALPLWHESVSGKFLLEPVNSAVVRAHVPGTVVQLYAEEGQKVTVGAQLASLRNLPLQSDYEDLRAKLALASDRANAASSHYADYGTALKEREQLAAQMHQLSEMNAALDLTSPISGTVITPKVPDLLGTYLTSGSEVLEVADTSTLRARIYVSEYDLYKIRPGAQARIQVRGLLRKWDAKIIQVAARPVEMDPRLKNENESKGIYPLHYYLVDVQVNNPTLVLRPGMTGSARVYGERRSLAGMAAEWIANFWGRKFW